MKEKLTANILFSGIGCQERGIKDTGLFDLDVVSTSDIDKDAILSYAAVHYGMTNEMVDGYNDYPPREQMAKELLEMNIGYDVKKDKPYNWMKLTRKKANDIEKYWLACKLSNQKGDISKIESLPYADLWTISFPCTNISVAGKMKGLKPNSGTASSLLWENIRLLKDSINRNESPKYLMFENVKNLVSKKFIGDFNDLLDVINELGFNTYWKVLNGKECGVPQNRERVFCIGIRKDIDTGKFEFPKPFDNGIRLKDILEDDIDEKYYLSKQIQDRFQVTDETFTKNIVGTTKPEFRTIGQRDLVYRENSIMGALVATDYKQPKQIIERYGMDKSLKNTRYNIDYANCITAREDCGSSPYFAQQGTAVLETNCIMQVGNYRLGSENFSNPQTGRVYSEDFISPTLNTMQGRDRQPKILNKFKIRKLMPSEYWRLMGLTFEDCKKARDLGVADCNLYKQAGNGIISDCVELIFEHLYKAQYNENFKCTDENFTQPQVD